jgi:hypothetical protein
VPIDISIVLIVTTGNLAFAMRLGRTAKVKKRTTKAARQIITR